MPLKPTKRKTPTAQTAGVPGANPLKPIKRTNEMNSNPHSSIAPALSFSLDTYQLRVIMIDGEPWFVAADVCALLGIKNPTMALKALDDDEIKLISDIRTLSVAEGNHGPDVQIRESRGNPARNLVSESGFYTLILRCRDAVKSGSMPHRVRRWVTGEVIPSIRKTGGYSIKKLVPWDREIGRIESLAMKLERAEDPFTRAMLISAAELAMAAVGLPMPDVALLRALPVATPKQLTFDMEGGSA